MACRTAVPQALTDHPEMLIAFNKLSTIGVRLPEDIGNRLTKKARLEDRERSDMVRETATEHLVCQERERYIAAMAAAARVMVADREARQESLEIAEQGLEVDVNLVGML